MGKTHLFAGIALLGLASACSQAPATNVVTSVEADDGAEVIVPEGTAEAANAAAGNVAEALPPALNLAPDGLSVVMPNGSARHATFGMPRDTALAMVTAALGKQTGSGRNEECGQGPMDQVEFRDGLSLSFQHDQFVGWRLDGRGKPDFSTAAGIGIGSTLKEMREAMADITVEDSTLGIEFGAGGLSGLLSSKAPGGVVEHLWAGSVCQFR